MNEQAKIDFCVEAVGPLPSRDDPAAIDEYRKATGLSWSALATAYGATVRDLKGLKPRRPHGHDRLEEAIATHGDPPARFAADPDLEFDFDRSGTLTFRDDLNRYRDVTGLKWSAIARFYGVSEASVRNWAKFQR